MEVCIIGGGFSGIAASKACKSNNLVPFVLEKDPTYGGTWNVNTSQAGAWNGLRLNSDKWASGFTDLLWDRETQPYPNRDEVNQYLTRYIHKHNLLEYFHFNSEVYFAEKVESGFLVKWRDPEGEHEKVFPALLVANGPFVGKIGLDLNISSFQGTVIHSADYRDSSIFSGKKVLVVGNSFSAAEIVLEAMPVASAITQVMRTKMVYMLRNDEKLPFTFPLFRLRNLTVPGDLFQFEEQVKNTRRFFLKIAGNPGKYNPVLQVDPEALDFEWSFGVREEYLTALGDGTINIVRGDFKEFTSNGVVLSDGTTYEADVVVLATGYYRNYDFLGENIRRVFDIENNTKGVGMTSFRSIFHPDLHNFGFIGQVNIPVPGRFELTSEIAVKWILQTLPFTYEELKAEVQREADARKIIGDKIRFYNFNQYLRELIRILGLQVDVDFIEREFNIPNANIAAPYFRITDPEIFELARTAAKELTDRYPAYFVATN